MYHIYFIVFHSKGQGKLRQYFNKFTKENKMSIFSNKSNLLSAYFYTLLIALLSCTLLSILYTCLPLKVQIIPILSNISLGLAVFIGSFSLSRRTPFFRITNVITLSSIIMISIFICTLCIGDLNIQIWLKKGLWILVSAFIGEIFGKL